MAIICLPETQEQLARIPGLLLPPGGCENEHGGVIPEEDITPLPGAFLINKTKLKNADKSAAQLGDVTAILTGHVPTSAQEQYIQ